MSRLAFFAALVATIGATLALAATSASAGKAPPQPALSPCIDAQTRGFPAMVFTRKRTTGGRVYVDTILSDLSGKCQQTIFSADTFAPPQPGADVNLRYDGTTGAGLIVRGGGDGGLSFVVSRFSVAFSPNGVPTVSSGSYSPLLALANLATPGSLAGWSKYVLANPLISPDGTKMLAIVAFRRMVGTVEEVKTTHWTCPFGSLSTLPVVVAAECEMRYNSLLPGEGSTAGWGGDSKSLYITDAASSGSGRSLYRLQLATLTNLQTFTEVWSLGTMFRDAKASLTTAVQELVAVFESGRPGNCTRILVIDAGTCPTGCRVVNGDGSPALSIAWLPDGRVAGEGRTAPDRRGQCSSTGSIVTFDPRDTNGITTTITPAGSMPDGAGGG